MEAWELKECGYFNLLKGRGGFTIEGSKDLHSEDRCIIGACSALKSSLPLTEVRTLCLCFDCFKEYSMETSVEVKKRLRGALLLNLGTPSEPTPSAVRAYLREFLMDPFVIDVPYLLRWVIVNLGVLPKRPISSALAYSKVWTERGSPLLFHLLDLCTKVQVGLGDRWIVKPAMRYGEPSIEKAFQEYAAQGINDITIMPLYPQYSTAATESSIQKCLELSKKILPNARIQMIPSFFDDQLFVDSFAEVATKSLQDFKYDHLLFSFHGLPERQLKKLKNLVTSQSSESTKNDCRFSEECCAEVGEQNWNCYRAQCFQSAKKIALKMGLKSDSYTVCFQSRLGRTPWIRPYTDEFYRTLPQKGIKRLGVLCPAFVSDCLETLEEVAIRGREEFISHGGEDLKLVPSLNSSETWARAVAEIIRK